MSRPIRCAAALPPGIQIFGPLLRARP
jgi:hypothetical protein